MPFGVGALLLALAAGAGLTSLGAYVATHGPEVVIEEATVTEPMKMGWKSWLVLGVIAIIIIFIVLKKFTGGG